METKADFQQITRLVKERDEHRQLLDQCLFVLNTLPNQKIGHIRTYDLASRIENSLINLTED
jgi:hypothetical protein